MRVSIFFSFRGGAMLRRKAEETLRQWADSDSRKCLMIRGARQVGKTFLADRLGEQFNQYVRINFLETPAMAAIFSGNLDVETLLMNFSVYMPTAKFEPGKTLLFLDEISSIPYTVQAKLLRVIQDGTFRPLGATKDKQVNVKIIGAMNVDPVKAIEEGTFRSDLFYRFSSGFISLVPLRERKEDIKLFIKYYVDYFAQVYSRNIIGIDRRVEDIFLNYSWEGNVRELRNVIEAMVVSDQDKHVMGYDELPDYFIHKLSQEETIYEKLVNETEENTEADRLTYHELMDRYEERIIRGALEEAGGNVSRAGELLDIPRETLRYRMKKLGL